MQLITIQALTRTLTRKGIRVSFLSHEKYIIAAASEFEYVYPDSTLIHDNSGELRLFPYNRYHFKDVRIVPYAPDMNAYAERFVRSIRRECLDHFVIFTHSQLRRLVQGYVEYYNHYRPHQGLKGIPNSPPEPGQGKGQIKQKPLLFGLHNHYYREAG